MAREARTGRAAGSRGDTVELPRQSSSVQFVVGLEPHPKLGAGPQRLG